MSSTPHDNPLGRPDRRLEGAGAHAASDDLPMTEPEVRARTESLGEMFSSFADHFSTLMRQELALAKAEATDTAKKAGTGAGMFAGAGVAAFFLLMFLSLALMWALGSVIHLGWAALIVAGIWAIALAVLAVIGKNRFNDMKGLPQTQDTMQDIPPTVNPRKETP